MIEIKLDILKDALPQLAKYLNANVDFNSKQSLLTLNNNKGKGFIKALTIFEGLESLIFDITFYQVLQCSCKSKGGKSLNFIFCQEGHIGHKFNSEAIFSKIEFQQNVVLKNNLKTSCVISLPAFTPLRISVVKVSESRLLNLGNNDRSGYQDDLLELFQTFPKKENYRHLGSLSPYTSIYVKHLMKEDKEGVANRLYKKSQVLNVLASQILKHNKDVSTENGRCNLRQIELDKIVGLAAFISDNISEPLKIPHLMNLSNLSPKKLQEGFQYLYDLSVANYISKVRLQKALHLLDATDYTISEVVYRVGLSSRSYFTKLFKTEYGVLPSDYKSSLKR